MPYLLLTWTVILAFQLQVHAKPSTCDLCGPIEPRPYHTPNCGCVTRGACSGEVGLNTRLVIGKSDLVCGLRFEVCCYEGPFPGVVDEFARAATCVPQEQCVRPYGILPTDVRDFGAIAPCPGHGAVRCIVVDSAGLLEFKAAVASIEASRVQTDAQQITPTHIDIPIQPDNQVHAVQSEDAGSISYSSVSTGATSPLLPSPALPPVRQGTIVQTVQKGPGTGSVSYTSVGSSSLPFPVRVPEVIPEGNVDAPPVSTSVTEVHSSAVSSLPVQPAAFVPSAPVPAPVVPPVVGGLYPGFGLGFGTGLGFRKHFSFTKGYGFGLGK